MVLEKGVACDEDQWRLWLAGSSRPWPPAPENVASAARYPAVSCPGSSSREVVGVPGKPRRVVPPTERPEVLEMSLSGTVGFIFQPGGAPPGGLWEPPGRPRREQERA